MHTTRAINNTYFVIGFCKYFSLIINNIAINIELHNTIVIRNNGLYTIKISIPLFPSSFPPIRGYQLVKN